jgi:hypothetical protein
MSKNSDKRLKRVLATISVAAGVAAGFVFFEYGDGIVFVLLVCAFFSAALFALATPQQLNDLFSSLSD